MKLPSVFANNDINTIDNNDKSCVTCREDDKKDLRDYFDQDGFARRLFVNLKTVDGSRDERLVLYRDQYVVNINNERIYLEDILDYEIKK